MMQRYPAAHTLLENEEDAITSGAYTPLVEDPEHSNPFATSAWELSTLQFHYHPQVASHASGAASLKMLVMPLEGYERVRSDLLEDSNEIQIPYSFHKKKHPLADRGQDNKRRNQIRFIKPRKSTVSPALLEYAKNP